MCFHAVYDEVEILSSAVQISDSRMFAVFRCLKKNNNIIRIGIGRGAHGANEGQHISVVCTMQVLLACADLLYFYIIKLLPYGWQILLCICINFELA